MPGSIATSLLLWATLLLPGASRPETGSARPTLDSALPCPSISLDHSPMIVQAGPLDRSGPWAVSEADSEEEGSGEDDAKAAFTEVRWPSLARDRGGHASIARRGLGIALAASRSPILRC